MVYFTKGFHETEKEVKDNIVAQFQTEVLELYPNNIPWVGKLNKKSWLLKKMTEFINSWSLTWLYTSTDSNLDISNVWTEVWFVFDKLVSYSK